MKKCAYCGEILGTPFHTKTDEHIIPASIINLYPEQDISIHNGQRFVDNRGMTIADVCSTCNNGVLSELDSYGKDLVERYFYIPYKFNDYYTPFDIELDCNLYIRWLLKMAYNSIRCDKQDIQYISDCIPYILGLDMNYPQNVSILLGIHINLNPMPEECFTYTPLQIVYSPQFYQNNYSWRNKLPRHFYLKDAGQTISIRIANSIALIVLWEPTVSMENKKSVITTLQEDFRFRLIHTQANHYSIRCVSSPTNVILGNYGHFYSEKAVAEIISIIKYSIQGRDIGQCHDEFSKLWTPEMAKKGRAFTEAAEFPTNTKKQKALQDLFDEKSMK